MRIVFAGTPDFAVPTLEALAESDHQLVGVITNPDRPRGRGSDPLPSPVKRAAVERDIPVYQPEEIDREATEKLEAWAPDAVVVAAYGQILPEWFLEWPDRGCINVHASLLPKYRGAAPIHWAILEGEDETGVTIMEMEPELDTGPILLQEAVEIGALETAESLHDRLANLGARLAVEALDRMERGDVAPTPQDDDAATYASKLSKSDGRIDWSEPAEAVANRIRGLNPWPGAFSELPRDGESERLKFHLAEPTDGDGEPGEVLEADPSGDRLVIACGEGAISVLEIQAPGGQKLDAGDFLNGYELERGDQFD